MKEIAIKSCYIGPEISPEEFIPEHFFIYLLAGSIDGYDGSKHYHLQSGSASLVRKNYLARYNKQKQDGIFEKVVVVFDAAFLKQYQKQHLVTFQQFSGDQAFLPVEKNKTLDSYIHSLQPLYNGTGSVIETKADNKRTELLNILLQIHPEYAAALFDFGKPGRLDLQAFMNKHYKFNVGIERFAFLTGRSLSAFKRDFSAIFQQTPSRWLVQKRLQEAYFLISKKRTRPNDFYLDLGFEDLSHFSFAFKKQFGITPSELATR